MVCRDFEGQHVDSGLLHGSRGAEWEGSSIPSNRVWLGNISATATLQSVRSVFSKFGPLTDAAVFPARIGPLGYAFVNFERVSDAAGAYQALNNVVLPALTGCKQLKMRFKPAKVHPVGTCFYTSVQRVLRFHLEVFPVAFDGCLPCVWWVGQFWCLLMQGLVGLVDRLGKGKSAMTSLHSHVLRFALAATCLCCQ